MIGIGSTGFLVLVTGVPLLALLLADTLVNHGLLTPYYRVVAVYWALFFLSINSIVFGVIAAQEVSLADGAIEYVKIGTTTLALSFIFALVEDDVAYDRLRSWLGDRGIGGGS